MMIESRRGLLCSECDFREATGCEGCVNMDKPFWADGCPVKTCCESKRQKHCGECDDFICSLLHSFAYDMEQGDDAVRIEQRKNWSKKFDSPAKNSTYIDLGDALMPLPKEASWQTFLNGVNGFSDDFLENGSQPAALSEHHAEIMLRAE